MSNKWASAQERKQKKVQTQTLAQLKQQVEALKKEIKEGKEPLRQKIEQLGIRVGELKKEKLHVELKLGKAERDNAGFIGEISKLCKELAEFHKKENSDASDQRSSIKSV